MKALILYRPASEFARPIEEYVHEFDSRRGKKIELVSLDDVKGSDMARLYDIVQYPALLVIKDDGQILKAWQGARMPLMDEVAGYLDA